MDKQQNNNFDALRLFGAMLVLVSHQFPLSGHDEPVFLGHTLGTIGVLIFFTISGYLVTASWCSDPHVPRFAARRLLRIWPALAVCVAACIAFVALCLIPAQERASAAPELVRYMLPNFVFAWRDGNFFHANPHPALNASLWTIPIEVQCYVALAALGFLARDRLRWVLVATAAIVLGLYFARWQAPAILAGYEFFLVEDSTNLPVYFLAGSLLGVIPSLEGRRAIATATVLGAVSAVAGFPGLAWAAIAPFIVLGVARRSWPFLRHASRFGDLSYGIYLWAWPVQQVVIMMLGKEAPLTVLLSVSLVAITGLALMSWHLVERPALRLKPNRASK